MTPTQNITHRKALTDRFDTMTDFQSISESPWFTPVPVPLHSTTTYAKPDAVRQFCSFRDSKTPKCLSKSPKVQNGLTEVLETPKHSVGVSDLSGTFLTQVSKHFQPKLSEVLDRQDL